MTIFYCCERQFSQIDIDNLIDSEIEFSNLIEEIDKYTSINPDPFEIHERSDKRAAKLVLLELLKRMRQRIQALDHLLSRVEQGRCVAAARPMGQRRESE